MRPTDADALFDFLTEQLDKETGMYSKGRNVGINIARSALHDKTITPTIAPPPNPPLTLDELRKMDGEPVFVTSSIGEQPMWYIVDVEENELKNPWDRITLEGWDEGHPYKAYRRKPEEGTT